MMASSMIAADTDWGPAQFLVGRWTGEGTGQPGNGSGAFSFTPELDGHILVRKSVADYPAAEGKPAILHEDLMTVYRDEASRGLLAIYFDSEGHTIRYTVSAAGAGVVFLSDGAAGQMRYRLTYMPVGKDKATVKFEVAPPGQDFATYLEGSVRRE